MHIIVFELQGQDLPIFDEIMKVAKCYPDIECLKIKDEPMPSLPGLEIYPGRRKICRDRREINFTTKEYDLLSLLVGKQGAGAYLCRIYRKI